WPALAGLLQCTAGKLACGSFSSFPLEQNVKAAVAVMYARCCQVSQSNPQCGPLVADALVTMAGAGKPQSSAGPTLAHGVANLELLDHRSAPSGPYSFPETTSCNIFLSRLKSATSCLSFRFSSSSCFRRRTSATPSPANFFF